MGKLKVVRKEGTKMALGWVTAACWVRRETSGVLEERRFHCTSSAEKIVPFEKMLIVVRRALCQELE